MRKVIALEFVTLDDVIQAGGGPEDIARFRTRMMSAILSKTMFIILSVLYTASAPS